VVNLLPEPLESHPQFMQLRVSSFCRLVLLMKHLVNLFLFFSGIRYWTRPPSTYVLSLMAQAVGAMTVQFAGTPPSEIRRKR